MRLMSRTMTERATDNRLLATVVIWGFATGMLAFFAAPSKNADRDISIAAYDSNRAVATIIAIMSATGASTFAIWLSSTWQSPGGISQKNDEVNKLKERIINLEEISCSTIEDLQKQLRQTNRDLCTLQALNHSSDV